MMSAISGSVRLQRSRHRSASSVSMAVISSMRRWWRPPSNGVSRKMRVISSASSGATIRAPIDSTLALLCCAGHARGVEVVAERGAGAVHLVGRDLLALAAAAEHDADVGVAAHDGARDRGAVRRVVDRLGAVGAEIVDVVAPLLQHPDEVLLERIAGVVAADRDAHAGECTDRALRASGASPGVVAGGGYRATRGRRSRAPPASRRRCCAGPTRCAGAAWRASTRGGKRNANKAGDVRFAVSNRSRADARLAQAELGPPRPEAFVDPTRPRARAARAVPRGRARLPRRVRRSSRRASSISAGRPHLAELGVDLVADLGIALELPDGRRELRVLQLGAPPPERAAARRRSQLRVRARAHRGVGARAARRSSRSTSSNSELARHTPDLDAERAEARAWISERVELVQRARRRRSRRGPAPTARAARSSPAATQFPG